MSVLMDDVRALRARIQEKKIEIDDAVARPIDDIEIKTRVAAVVEAAADRARAHYALDQMAVVDEDGHACGAERELIDIAPFDLMALVDAAKLKRVLSDVAIAQRDGTPMGGSDKRATLERLRSELLSLEESEEEMIRLSEDAGAPIRRRGDADPVAVLSLDSEENE